MLRNASAWIRARAGRWAVLLPAGLLVLALRPATLAGQLAALAGLSREREALREEVRALSARNAALADRVMAVQRGEPFEVERLSREAGLLRPGEFDYAAVGAALSIPPCPPAPRPGE